jgi:hypothetical protein
MGLDGFSQRWKDFPDYIIGITREIWEDRSVETLNRYYSPDIPVRSPMGIQVGNQQVIASTMATIHEFPDRELFGEDVIWSEHETGLLSSHRLLTTGTHSNDGAFGKASGKRFTIYVIADCAARNDTIFDEWLIRDYGGMVRQLGLKPRAFARELIKREGGAENCNKPFTPAIDIDGPYKGRGNDNEWGERYAALLKRLMDKEFDVITKSYDRAIVGHYAGGQQRISHGPVTQFWVALRSAFPNAEFKIHHQIGMDSDMLSPRAAIRWSLDGKHEGWGAFGKPTGAHVHVMGMNHAEFGPFAGTGQDGPTVRREWALYDEVAVWKQILMHTGDQS